MQVIVYPPGCGRIAVCACWIRSTRKAGDARKGWVRTYPFEYRPSIPARFGLLRLTVASSAGNPWAFWMIALPAFYSAVVAFTNQKKIYRRQLDWYIKRGSDQTNRLLGIIGIIFGTAILTWILSIGDHP